MPTSPSRLLRIPPLALAAMLIASVGCSGRNRDREDHDGPAAAQPAQGPRIAEPGVPASFSSLTVLDGRTGEPVSWDDLINRCAAAHAVLIGEEHDLGPAQMMAADLFAAIVADRPGAALSLEFFERDEQVHLDDYVAGITDEEQFRSATGRREGNYPDGHRAMVEAARAAGVPIIASNAPRRYVRLARTEGYDHLRALSGAQRAMFAIPSPMPSGRYRQSFIDLMVNMGSHGAAPAGPEPSEADRIRAAEAGFRSQAMWDATMAESIAGAIEDGHRPVVHVIGRFHTDLDGGTVQMLRRMRGGARVLTLSCTRADSTALRDEDRGIADVVVYVPEALGAPTGSEGTPSEGEPQG